MATSKICISIRLLLAFSLVVALFGCEMPKQAGSTMTPKLKVGLLVEGNIFDQSWDSLAYQTLRKVERELGAEIDYVELNGVVTDAHIEERATAMIDHGFDILFGHGRIFQDTFNRLGMLYPDVTFVFFNGSAHGDNVYSISFAAESIGFFAGVGAALMTKSNIVGVVTAYPNQLEVTGFQAGVHFISDRIEIVHDAVGDWGDRERGKALAFDVIDRGADVVIGFGDGFNIEVINAARERGVYAIGFLTDQSFIARDTVLFSVTQNVEKAYMGVLYRILTDSLVGNAFPTLDFDNGGQNITPYSNHVPMEVRLQIDRIMNRYLHGEIEELR